VLIKVEGVGKKFCRDLKKSLWYGAQDIVAELAPGLNNAERHATLRPQEFWAVDNVSFELRRGECLGLIGRNGAGKTTLLKMLNGLIKPDKGRIEMRGRVGALIALGAGFNPILTGRENIYVNASVLGLSKKAIDNKIDEIIDFAEIEEFIDSPVQTYSSGMQVRLGFAIATAINPDVLIIDEVFAVGDRPFRQKCFSRLGKLREMCCMIFVSHQMEHVTRMCERCLLLDKGKASHFLSVLEAINEYDILCLDGKKYIHNMDRRINRFIIETTDKSVSYGGNMLINCTIDSLEYITDTFFQIFIRDVTERIVAEWTSLDRCSEKLEISPGMQIIGIELKNIRLSNGNYTITYNIFEKNRLHYIISSVNEVLFTVTGRAKFVSTYQL